MPRDPRYGFFTLVPTVVCELLKGQKKTLRLDLENGENTLVEVLHIKPVKSANPF